MKIYKSILKVTAMTLIGLISSNINTFAQEKALRHIVQDSRSSIDLLFKRSTFGASQSNQECLQTQSLLKTQTPSVCVSRGEYTAIKRKLSAGFGQDLEMGVIVVSAQDISRAEEALREKLAQNGIQATEYQLLKFPARQYSGPVAAAGGLEIILLVVIALVSIAGVAITIMSEYKNSRYTPHTRYTEYSCRDLTNHLEETIQNTLDGVQPGNRTDAIQSICDELKKYCAFKYCSEAQQINTNWEDLSINATCPEPAQPPSYCVSAF